MLESLNTGVFEYEKLSPEEMKARGILGRLVGVMADTVNPTRNGRAYSSQLWENVFNNPIMQERIENKCCFGELGHPIDREETDMEKIAICMDAVPKKDSDGKLQAVFNILDTPNGRILKTLCDYGCNIGISSRGSGDLIQDFDGNESVDPDTYNCEGWDAVLIPAVKEARLKYVNESLEKTRYKKSLRTRLQEAIEKADEDHKKSMTESLHTFLGEGIWDEIESGVEQPEAGPEPDPDFVNELDANMGNEPADTLDAPPEGDILDTPPEGGDDLGGEDLTLGDLGDLPEDDLDFGDMDMQIDDAFSGPAPIRYKGVDIIEDEKTGKFVLEIDKETYIFNSEKNAKIWVDMNQDKIQEERLDDNVEDHLDATVDAEEDKIDKSLLDDEEPVEEEPMQESLNEEQEGRDTHKDDKDEDEVQHPEERKEDSSEDDDEDDDKKKKSITVTVDEALGDKFVFDKDDLSVEYADLNDAEQSAVESVIDIIDDEVTPDILRELCVTAMEMMNDANGAPEYENTEFFAETGDPEAVYNFIVNNADKYNIILHEKVDESKLNCNESVDKEAGDAGAEVDSLKEMLDYNIKLEQKVIGLQEKLSVSHAEETKLAEEVANLKERLAKLSQVSKENKALKEQIKTLKDSSTKLNESVTKSSTTAKKLNEQLKAVKEERDSAKNELEALKEDYSSLEKDSTQLKEQLGKKLDRQNKLLEKYQKITKNSVDRYINLQATNLGVKPAEIKNKLPDKFSFSEIDSICEELRDYKLSVSRLPFSASKPIREGNVRVNNLSPTLSPVNEMDELTDYDMKLLELFK